MTENCKLRKAILSAFYNILQRNFGILLILWCSFKLWRNFCLGLLSSKCWLIGEWSIFFILVHFSHASSHRVWLGRLSACVRKQKVLKIFCFVICVEDYHELIQTQFLIHCHIGNLTSPLKNRRMLKLAIVVRKSYQSKLGAMLRNLYAFFCIACLGVWNYVASCSNRCLVLDNIFQFFNPHLVQHAPQLGRLREKWLYVARSQSIYYDTDFQGVIH